MQTTRCTCRKVTRRPGLLASNVPSAAGDQTEQLAGYFSSTFMTSIFLLDPIMPAPKGKFIWGFVYEDVVEMPFQGLQR